jgi:serine/threonine-protein kinase
VAGYRLEEQIGQGGMALVYRARDVQLGRNVALKLLSPTLGSDESFRERFIRESRAAAAVDHPNIIPIFAAGQSDGVLYIAMRFVQGGDVRQLVDQLGPLPGDRAAGIITQVASALDAAHLHGLVHRDIKPANMLLDSSGGNGEQDHVYLADFGLSKRSLSVTGLTSMGQFLGTPAYVAPEQVEGHAVDGRTDQYALACTAFEMLTGSPPFQRDDDLAIMWAQVSAPPPALSEQRPDLPPAVDGVLRRALAKSPADRYPSCLAFAAALRAALAQPGQPAARPEPAAGPGSTMVSGAPGRLRDTPQHPPTQISHPGAAAAAGAGQAAFAEDEPSRAGEFTPPTAEGPVPWPGAAAPASPGSGSAGAPVSDPGARVFPPTEDWESPGRVQPPSPGVPQYQPSQPSHPSQQSPQYPQTQESRQPAPRQPAYLPPGGPAGRGPSGPSGPADRGPGRAPRRKSLWWPRGAIAVGCVAVVGVAIGVFAALHGGGGKNEAASGAADNNPTQGAAAAAPLAPLTAPGCRTVVARAAAVAKARTESVAVGDEPFAVTTTSDGRYTFVSRKDAIVVLASHGGLAPAVDHVISVPGAGHGTVLTHDGKYLITAVNSGAVVLDVAAAEQGSSAVMGTLSSSYGTGAFGVAISPDDQFAFVTLQNNAALAVFNLKTALSRGFGSAYVVGKIGLGQQPAGLGLSTDNRWLYAASYNTNATLTATNGMVTVIDLARAETNPAQAVKTRVQAGCAPVRVIASADGQTIWVTSRDSDALLGFSAAKMVSDPTHALKAKADVGTAPIGETFANVNGQTRILVADSNLNSVSGAVANVAVIDPAKALRRVPSLLGYVSTGKIPRQFTIQPGGKTALVTNTGSGQLQAIDLGTLP